MSKKTRPRKGSLQYWPRKRATKFLPSVNWFVLKGKSEKPGFLGFIAYKVGMASCVVKDSTEHSLTKNKRIIIPGTILETPAMKIFSVRFYKHNLPVNEIIISTDKELKRKLKLPKQKQATEKEIEKKLDEIKDYNDLRVVVYSIVKSTGIKKTPDLTEIALGGTKDEKLSIIKNFINKEITINDVSPIFGKLVDARGITKGYGNQGPVKRFGITLRFHKSEKGVRKVGSIAPWYPARLTFRTPMAGQTGFFTRLAYNKKIISSGKISERDINPKQGWKNFGKIRTDYIILEGSVQGPKKRQMLLTQTLRPTRKQLKKNYELIEMI